MDYKKYTFIKYIWLITIFPIIQKTFMNLKDRFLRFKYRFRLDEKDRPIVNQFLINSSDSLIVAGSDFPEFHFNVKNVIFIRIGMIKLNINPSGEFLKISVPLKSLMQNKNIEIIGAYQTIRYRLEIINDPIDLTSYLEMQQKLSSKKTGTIRVIFNTSSKILINELKSKSIIR